MQTFNVFDFLKDIVSKVPDLGGSVATGDDHAVTKRRLAAFGLFANFMVYLTREFHLDQVYASNILNIWSGITNFFPLIGAFISDAYVGRFWTIAFASFSSLLVQISFNVHV